jgi:protoheme ferro-lyase
MSAITKQDLLKHLECTLQVAFYSTKDDTDEAITSVCIECTDCNEVLFEIGDEITEARLEGEIDKYDDLTNKMFKLTEEFEQYKRESVKWSVDDFLFCEMPDGWTITEEQAQNALEQMIHKHDAGIGITWNTIEVYYREYGTRKTKEDEEEG